MWMDVSEVVVSYNRASRRAPVMALTNKAAKNKFIGTVE